MIADNCGLAPMLPVPYRIARRRRDTHDTFTLELVPADGGARVTYAPGQFNMLYVFGVGEVPISVSGDPTAQKCLVHTVRAVGTVTQAMARLRRGDTVGVRGAYGSAWPLQQAAGCDVVIVTGGIGLAPLRPAIYGLLEQRRKYGRIVLLYGARTPADLLYAEELAQWRGRFDLHVDATLDNAGAEWFGKVGVVTRLIPTAPFDPDHTVALICGPEVMMRYTVRELRQRGVADENIYLSMERNMKCAVGFCGHCQYGPSFICKDGPVYRYDRIRDWLAIREL